MNNLDDLEGEDFADNEEVDGTPEAYHAEVSANPVNVTTLGEEYDYDVETNLNSFFWDELLPTLIVYSLTFILGLVGNILIIFTTFRYRKMKSTTNVFLASLASADLLLIVFCIPVKEYLSNKDNSPTMANCRETPKELSKQLALYKLRDILDELITDEEKPEEVTGSPDTRKGGCTTNQINASGEETPENAELEELMFKLKTALKNCSELLQPEETSFHEGTRFSQLLAPKDDFLKGIAPLSVPPIIAYPAFTVHRLRNGSGSRRKNEETESKGVQSHKCDCGTRRKLRRDGKAQPWLLSSSGRAEHLVMAQVASERVKDEELGSINDSTGMLLDNSENLDRLTKSIWRRNSVKSTESMRSYRPENSRSSGVPSPGNGRKKQSNAGKEESGKSVERKILKLECRLKDMLRRLKMCSPNDEIAIRKCLERLRETSEAILKRLRTDRFDSYQRYCIGHGEMLGVARRGYHSEPDSAVRVNAIKKPVILKTSGSEIQLNVGMEITMENFDPVTGRKLSPEKNRDFEQQGNIQCKLVKPGEKPVTFIDTDFLYNPKTGMLFQKGQKVDRKYRSKEYKESLKPTKAYLLSKMTRQDFPAETDSDTSGRKSETHNRDKHLETKEYGDRGSSPETSKSVVADAFRLAIEREENKNVKHVEDGMDTSRSFPKEKPKCAGKHCNQRRISLNPTVAPSEKQGIKEVSSHGMLKVLDKKPQQNYHLHDRPQGNYTNTYREGITIQTVMVSDKGTQTNLGPRWKTSSESIPKRSMGVQAELAKLFSYTWTFGFFICKLVYYMQSVSAICSVLTLTAMSVERYYAIVHPMRAQYVCTISQARRIITFTWISSFFLAIPVLFAQIHMPVGVRVKGFWCVRDYDNPTIWRAHETYMLLLILVIPTGVMGVAYTTICLEIWQVMQRRQDLTSAKILNIRYNKTSINSESFSVLGKEKKQQRNTYGESPDDEAHVKQVIKMLVAVVVIYVVCWAPLLIDNILQAYGVLPFMKFGKQKYMAIAFHLMAYFNSCINPIVYGFMSKNFRESFRKTLCCTTRKGHTSMRNTSMSHDRNTSIRYAESRSNRSYTDDAS